MMAARTSLVVALALAAAEAKVCDDQSKVQCVELSGGGVQMPEVSMGTWSGSYGDCAATDFTCVNQHARFASEMWLHIGGRHIDGANVYRTQTSIAEALKGSPGLAREDVFLTTKCTGAQGFEAIIQCAEDNLQMLGQFGTDGVGYIDLLLIHFPGLMKPMCRFKKTSPECSSGAMIPATKEQLQDSWRAMEELKRIGVVRAIGVSDYSIEQLQDTLATATQPLSLHQHEWNPLTHDDGLLDFCKQHGIQLQAWSPLGGSSGGNVLSDPTMKRVAAAHGVFTPQVALKWSLQRGVAVVVGTANPYHAKGDMDLYGFQLSDEEVDAISALGAPTVLLA